MQKLWPPLATRDFAPYLAQLRRDVDAIYCVFSGADALRFSKQYAEAGLKGKLPLIGGGTFTDEHVLRDHGRRGAGRGHRAPLLGRPHHARQPQVRPGLRGQVQAGPSYYSEGTYVAGIALKAALEGIGGDIENADKFLGALRRVDLSDAPRGPMRFDDFGNPIQNIYVRKVEKVGGRLQNTVIHTFPEREPVLDLQAGRLPQEPRLLARLSAVHQVLAGERGSQWLPSASSASACSAAPWPRASSPPATRWWATTSCRAVAALEAHGRQARGVRRRRGRERRRR